MYYQNIKAKGKINHYKLLENYMHLHAPILCFGTYHTYLHTNRTCQKVNIFIEPICISSLVLKGYFVAA